MKITFHWTRIITLLSAIVALLLAIQWFKYFDQFNQQQITDIGQCDIHEAQQIIDHLVSIKRNINFLS